MGDAGHQHDHRKLTNLQHPDAHPQYALSGEVAADIDTDITAHAADADAHQALVTLVTNGLHFLSLAAQALTMNQIATDDVADAAITGDKIAADTITYANIYGGATGEFFSLGGKLVRILDGLIVWIGGIPATQITAMTGSPVMRSAFAGSVYESAGAYLDKSL